MSVKRPFSSITGGDGGDDDVGSGVADGGDGVKGSQLIVSETGGEKAKIADADDGSGGVGAAAKSEPAAVKAIPTSETGGEKAELVAGVASRSRRVKKPKKEMYIPILRPAFECSHPGCAKTFPTVRKKNSHMISHSLNKYPYACTVPGCFHTYARESGLQVRK
jgi:hypothetical protein